eukprot:TRINITY_DN1844_c2_g1_i1.p1 TRINITY_DN1844_c2_g1~~TRINITY_DN1844_c2_g1_i1.p1  ORF type:complete len:409 (-),score=178.22 TRINITY_DN1844_c2_g1_i1:95-1321(-)
MKKASLFIFITLLLLCFLNCFIEAKQRKLRFVKPVDVPKDYGCDDPDCNQPTPNLITSKGYPAESHTVTTEDGFILTMHRIPRPGAPAIFLQHGLEDASHTWVINFPAQSLGFILYDAGYDVWMGNSRGNTYSRSHVSLDPDDHDFWQWSFDEMAKYDLPAQLNYTLNYTNNAKLIYVGHSQGTLQAFIFFATNNPLVEKVSLFVALAPIAYLGHVESILLQLMATFHLEDIFFLLGWDQFLTNQDILSKLLPGICDFSPFICTSTLCILMGCDPANWNQTRYPVYVSLDPAGTSTVNMAHYSQGVRTDKYCMYDYGAHENEQKYGQRDPPNYHLGDVKVPVAIFTGGKDVLADPKDVSRLKSELPQNLIVHENDQPTFSHLDFVWGLDANRLIYSDILYLASKYSGK